MQLNTQILSFTSNTGFMLVEYVRVNGEEVEDKTRKYVSIHIFYLLFFI